MRVPVGVVHNMVVVKGVDSSSTNVIEKCEGNLVHKLRHDLVSRPGASPEIHF